MPKIRLYCLDLLSHINVNKVYMNVLVWNKILIPLVGRGVQDLFFLVGLCLPLAFGSGCPEASSGEYLSDSPPTNGICDMIIRAKFVTDG